MQILKIQRNKEWKHNLSEFKNLDYLRAFEDGREVMLVFKGGEEDKDCMVVRDIQLKIEPVNDQDDNKLLGYSGKLFVYAEDFQESQYTVQERKEFEIVYKDNLWAQKIIKFEEWDKCKPGLKYHKPEEW